MRGDPEVIDYLNKLLVGELAARDQYFIHSRMYDDWDLKKLYERLNHEMTEETDHADQLMRRILFLEGKPNMRPDDLNIGTTVKECLELDLQLELHVRQALADGIKLCEEKGDFVSRDILREQLYDTEEDHAYWLEKQLGLIEKMGIENYHQLMV